MIDYISISTLNDFIICPYSIYLHNVYMETDETIYHATPQTQGRMAHATIDKKTASNRSDVILSLPVYSEEYGLMGIKETMNFYYCRWSRHSHRGRRSKREYKFLLLQISAKYSNISLSLKETMNFYYCRSSRSSCG